MILILTLILLSTSVRCYDWCPLVKPNGNYGGLGLFHRFADSLTDSGKDYVVFNRAGHEWSAQFKSATDLTLEMIDSSVKAVEDKGIVNKFGTFALYDPKLKKPGGRPRECSVISMAEKGYQINCRDAQQNAINALNSSGSTDLVIMKVYANITEKEQSSCLIFYKDSTNKSEYFEFNPFEEWLQSDCSQSQKEMCRVPLFVQQMDDSLFRAIDSVVDFSLKRGSVSGHLILFNIEGKPKYCTTIEGQSLSDEV